MVNHLRRKQARTVDEYLVLFQTLVMSLSVLVGVGVSCLKALSLRK